MIKSVITHRPTDGMTYTFIINGIFYKFRYISDFANGYRFEKNNLILYMTAARFDYLMRNNYHIVRRDDNATQHFINERQYTAAEANSIVKNIDEVNF